MIRELMKSEPLPIPLLLLADPSEFFVRDYTKRGWTFVLETDHGIIGVYVLLPTRPGTVEIVNVAVDEAFHGKGFGRQLIHHAVDTAKSSGFRTIDIGTGNSGMVQLALYQKCGFRMTAIDIGFFLKHYDTPIYENGIQVTDMVRLSMDL